MTNPFTAFAFEASGNNVNTSRTLPNRLTDITDVKDYGAVGDGVTNDYAAIWAAFNHGAVTLTTTASNRTGSFTGVLAGGVLTVTGFSGAGIAAGNLLIWVQAL